MLSDITNAVKVVEIYNNTHSYSQQRQADLVALAGRVSNTISALDRRRYMDRLSPTSCKWRESARLAALEAAGCCLDLYRSQGGGIFLPSVRSVAKPSRKRPDPARSAIVQINVLARAFAGIYIDYIIFEARALGRLTPVESVKYVRDFRATAGRPAEGYDEKITTLVGYRRVVKRVFDVAVGTSSLVLLAPLFLLIATIIKLSDDGPAFFKQTRVGRDGRAFTVFKFRTMVVDAEQRTMRLLESNSGDGVLFKMRRDPRVTRVGGWLRRYSLDELPQLINVLVGDMSLVGPRPALPQEAALYGDHVRRRLAVKPGVTGLWQVNGRSDLSWDDYSRLDMRYVENWSFALDLQILWKTWSAIFHGSGAY